MDFLLDNCKRGEGWFFLLVCDNRIVQFYLAQDMNQHPSDLKKEVKKTLREILETSQNLPMRTSKRTG